MLRKVLLRIVLAALIVAAGLGVRAAFDDPVAKYGGVALYAALVYVLVTIVWPKVGWARACALAIALCFAIELFQLTPIPARLAGEHRVFALVLGTTFHWWDFVAYSAGALVAAGVHWAVGRG